MIMKHRYLKPFIAEFMKRKMVFVGGPRQVGKTTLCIDFLNPPSISNPAYLNWDDIQSKSIIRGGLLPAEPVILLDEVHKFKQWRNLLKGFYDKHRDTKQFLVTGSAKLDHYRRGGDSLLGRYRYLRLHPFSIGELKMSTQSDLANLSHFGGFPEPFLAGSERDHKLWKRERLYRVVNDDIRDLEGVREFSKLEMLAETLPSRVGSPLSIKALSEDLEVNFRTAEKWVQVLEAIYYCFRIAPYGQPKIRAVKKEKKLYLWDWSSIGDTGLRFENLVASHLLKYCHFIEDTEGDSMDLRFLRDTDKREVDFVVLKNNKPLFAVECKTGEKAVSRHLYYFRDRTPIPAFFQVHTGARDFQPDKQIRVLPLLKFSQELGLV